MKRERGYAAVSAVVGAGAAVLAVSRGWFQATGPADRGSFVTAAERVAGSERYPWLWALALVALAGGGAVLATKGVVRTVVGWILVVAGAGLVIGGAVAVAHEAAPFWPIVTVLGGAAVFDAGWADSPQGTVVGRHGRALRADHHRVGRHTERHVGRA